jgi:hypothetical protein
MIGKQGGDMEKANEKYWVFQDHHTLIIPKYSGSYRSVLSGDVQNGVRKDDLLFLLRKTSIPPKRKMLF